MSRVPEVYWRTDKPSRIDSEFPVLARAQWTNFGKSAGFIASDCNRSKRTARRIISKMLADGAIESSGRRGRRGLNEHSD